MFVPGRSQPSVRPVDPAARARLAALDQLTPGDFAAVCRQAEILGDALEPDAFLSQLESEHRAKPEVRQRRAIGFRS